jgi:hypothetical protein
MSHNNEIGHDFSGLAIWDHFINTSNASHKDIAMVQLHIDLIMPLLDRYSETFPKYTLHNSRHQKNILKIMGDLLGDKVSELTDLECGMLILSTIYHDIGMVYTKEEIEAIINEPSFFTFIQSNPNAQLKLEENNGQPTEDIIEWYCRYMHAKRVWIYLNEKDSKVPLVWGTVTIKEALGHLCESHNYSISEIISSLVHFKTNYLGKCDLVFCTILLRLADILDFDNSRSPESVYEYLDLDNPKNALDSYSKTEWQKHLSSNGFIFNRNCDNFEVLFIATPTHPSIEVAIRSYIKLIDKELSDCTKLQRHCSEKWQHHLLPDVINMENLTPKNYQSGDYHFSLSQEKILTLLTGDGLYDDDFVFIRELLQNAIDSTRHREFLERQTNTRFKASPIEVSFFSDKEGYRWIRIDDYGMGMDETIIINHLLKKGESYYNSDRFKIEKIQIKKNLEEDFVPISRFGIGLLSCFLSGDRIEISTQHRFDPNNSYRLGIEGRNGHYTLQSLSKHHVPNPMPAEFVETQLYRSVPGTSIAVRISTNKEFLGFDMRRELLKYILCPPVPVLYNGEQIGGDPAELLIKSWGDDEIVLIDSEFTNQVEQKFDIKFKDGLKINIENIDITKKSLSPNLKGQLLFLAVDAEYTLLGENQNAVGFHLSYIDEKLWLRCYRRESKGNGVQIEREEKKDITFIQEKIRIPKRTVLDPFSQREIKIYDGIMLSHNGIQLNDSKGIFTLDRNVINSHFSHDSHNNFSFLYFGILYFQDELLPELSVSRSDIKRLSFSLISYLSFAMEQINKYINQEMHKFHFFDRRSIYLNYTSLEIDKLGFYTKNKAFLDDYIKLDTNKGIVSISELLSDQTKNVVLNTAYYFNRFYTLLVNFIIDQNFEVTIKMDDRCHTKYSISRREQPFLKELLDFPPLTFVRFEGDTSSLNKSNKLNIAHPFMQWYIRAAHLLTSQYFNYSKQLIYSVYGGYNKKDSEILINILKRLDQVLPTELRPIGTFRLHEADLTILD